ncbi:MAG: LemA family protein, partial [Planctomycetota bacterium]|nr:LemA family protein [Planctomycetota bacterium]
MEPLWIFLGVLIVVPLAIIFYAISIYNGLVSLRNGYENAFSQIDVQLTRRYDLIPNLVETAKGYMKHEKDTLEAVIEADRDSKNGMRKRQGEGSVPTGSHKVVVE